MVPREVNRSGRPQPGEYAAYAEADIDHVDGEDAVEALERQAGDVAGLFAPLDETMAGTHTYAPGKWTLKQILGHLIDDERIFAYRILCVARNDRRPLPGFDENDYMRAADFNARTLDDLLAEYRTVRAATVALLRPMNAEVWLRRGIVNEYEASVRGLAFHIAGHELHHLRVVRERYL